MRTHGWAMAALLLAAACGTEGETNAVETGQQHAALIDPATLPSYAEVVAALEAAAIDGDEEEKEENHLAEATDPTKLPRSLRLAIAEDGGVPTPTNLADFVRNRSAAIALGKALFWDVQLGADGQIACATCHHQAGADGRTANTVHPGADWSFATCSPMDALAPSDFPFSPAPWGTGSDDVVGSQGVTLASFDGVVERRATDDGTSQPDTIFHTTPTGQENDGTWNARQVTGRNAPSVINAVFNYRNFWDGRANPIFNGVDHTGPRNPDARVWITVCANGACTAQPQPIEIDSASLASQAVGPPNNGVEMAWNGRSFPMLGRKMLSLRPLASQRVHHQDSVLGPLRHYTGWGLDADYRKMVRDAFQPKLWNASNKVLVDGELVTQMEANFSLFFGLAIQLYESTLVSDETPFDRWAEGAPALTAEQIRGFEVFMTNGLCFSCHAGPEFTTASVRYLRNAAEVAWMPMLAGNALYDEGFYNLGVRPIAEDPGVAALGAGAVSLAHAVQASTGTIIDRDLAVHGACEPGAPPIPGVTDCAQATLANLLGLPVAVEGTFKTPGLRNVALNGPYMHNGGFSTLEQVMEFYGRGGDFVEATLHPDMQGIVLTRADVAALVAFMESLTDERVLREKAPFDHPGLQLPNGLYLQDTGRDGNAAPLLPFAERL